MVFEYSIYTESIKEVQGKGKINYAQFEEDILDFLGYTKEEMKEYF